MHIKKYSNFEEKHIEDLINTRRIEVTNIMKGIGDIKHKIDYLDLKQLYFFRCKSRVPKEIKKNPLI